MSYLTKHAYYKLQKKASDSYTNLVLRPYEKYHEASEEARRAMDSFLNPTADQSYDDVKSAYRAIVGYKDKYTDQLRKLGPLGRFFTESELEEAAKHVAELDKHHASIYQDFKEEGAPPHIPYMVTRDDRNRWIGHNVDRLKKLNAYLGTMAADVTVEEAVEKGTIRDKLLRRGLSYGASGGIGGLLGALIAGRGRRLLGGGIGLAAGLLANYLRRKSYYGKTVKW